MTDLKTTAHTTTEERESQQTIPSLVSSAETQESQFVNLTIKVHRRQRLHWLIEAKKQRTSLTAAITDALNERFGTPD